MVKIKVKFNKFVHTYSNCFYNVDKETFLMSLGQRLVRNMCSCEVDMYNFYHHIYKILNRNNLNNMYFIQGIEDYLHKNELIFSLTIMISKLTKMKFLIYTNIVLKIFQTTKQRCLIYLALILMLPCVLILKAIIYFSENFINSNRNI
jgi:hypothetical protein